MSKYVSFRVAQCFDWDHVSLRLTSFSDTGQLEFINRKSVCHSLSRTKNDKYPSTKQSNHMHVMPNDVDTKSLKFTFSEHKTSNETLTTRAHNRPAKGKGTPYITQSFSSVFHITRQNCLRNKRKTTFVLESQSRNVTHPKFSCHDCVSQNVHLLVAEMITEGGRGEL